MAFKARKCGYASKHNTIVVLIVICTLLCISPAFCEKDEAHPIKAAFVYSFCKFVEWPDGSFSESSSPIVVGVYRDSEFADVLEKAVKGKTAGNRKLVVKRFNKITEITRIHILFISSPSKGQLSEILEKTKDQNTLTIGESNGFANQGCIIDFVEQNNKVSFEINVGASEKAKLKISSKLLKLAKIIE